MKSYFAKRPFIFFILPAFIMYTVFVIYPLVFVGPYSLTKWDGVSQMQFTGLKNYLTIFSNSTIVSQLKNAYANIGQRLLINYLIVHPILIIVAYLIVRKIPGSVYFRTVIFMPNFFNYVAIAFIVTLFFSPSFGLYATVMKAIGLKQFATAGIWVNPSLGVALTVLVAVWKTTGYELLLYIAAFNVVPIELDESARMDGAGEIRRFFFIYFPISMPAITNILILQYISSLLSFEASYMLGGLNGGVGGCMDTLMLFFYRNVFDGGYASNFVGMGSAFSMLIVAPIMLGVLLLLLLMRRFRGEAQ